MNFSIAVVNFDLKLTHMSLTDIWVRSEERNESLKRAIWSRRPSMSARLYKYILRGTCRIRLAFISYSIRTISWSALPIGGIPLTRLTGDGEFVNNKSRIFSWRVDIFTTWARQCSLIMSKSCCCVCLLDTPWGTYILLYSISPQLKSPPTKMWAFAFDIILSKDELKASRYSVSILSGGRLNGPRYKVLHPIMFNLHQTHSQLVSNSGISVQRRSRLKATKTSPCASPTLSFRIASMDSGKISVLLISGVNHDPFSKLMSFVFDWQTIHNQYSEGVVEDRLYGLRFSFFWLLHDGRRSCSGWANIVWYRTIRLRWLHAPINFSIGYNGKSHKVSYLLHFPGLKSDPNFDGMW